MKKHILVYLLALSALVGCRDNSGLYGLLNDYDYRIIALEKLCNQMNTNIQSLQTIVNAMQVGDYITSVTPIMENGVEIGYTMTFANSSPITIYHGKNGKDGKDGQDGQDGTNGTDGTNGQDGHTPIIGVAQDTDGVYYWTLDGIWLLDGSGNKIRVTGKDGKDGQDGTNGSNGTNGQDGITPQLKIEADYWWISYDNGTTWTKLGKAKGDKGADGQDGDSMFQSVTYDDDYVYFKLANGIVITVLRNTSDFNQTIIDNLVTSLTVSSPKDTIVVGEQIILNAVSAPFPNSKKTWKSSNTAVASVGDSIVTGVSVGIVKIIVTCGDKIAEYKIYVKNTEDPYFSISATQKVMFAPGNLQYRISNKKWYFAFNQYAASTLSYALANTQGKDCGAFPWGGSGYNGRGVNSTTTLTGVETINGTKYDWGKYCAIDNYPKGTWRTIARTEMKYIINDRSNASSKYMLLTIGDVYGALFLPDNWVKPVQVKSFSTSNPPSVEELEIMQLAGAVFLQNGSYWTATGMSSGNAYYLYIREGYAMTCDTYVGSGSTGLVRLVRDIE